MLALDGHTLQRELSSCLTEQDGGTVNPERGKYVGDVVEDCGVSGVIRGHIVSVGLACVMKRFERQGSPV